MKKAEQQVHVLRLDKGGERYILLYTSDRRSIVLRRLSEWAANPELSFSWYDAARMSHEVRT